jgi:hypothetical protein
MTTHERGACAAANATGEALLAWGGRRCGAKIRLARIFVNPPLVGIDDFA